uniref:MerR family transcriptional regulator n=1 Tax=Rhodovarius lipocyclicus TaxID=268410 RepID=UPI00135A9956
MLGADALEAAEPRVRKGAQAYRTISEVAEELNVPQHVLRFWEGKFPQLKPLKRGGGRRYYRPEDIALLRRIAGLLYSQGYTIKGVQRLLSDDAGTPAPDMPGQGVDGAMAALEAVAAELRDLLKRR